MVGMSTVLEYPYPQQAGPDRFSLGQVDYFNGHEGSLGLEEVTNLAGFNQDLSERRFGLTLAAKDTLSTVAFSQISVTSEPVVAGVRSVRPEPRSCFHGRIGSAAFLRPTGSLTWLA